jgi:1-acyl-sn-glycerol-3-phosphate acyltransferase
MVLVCSSEIVVRGALRRAVRVTAFTVAAGGILPVHAVHERLVAPNERDELRERYKRAWCGAMLRLFGIRARVIGALPTTDSGVVIVANHRSAIDIAVMFWVFGGHMLSRADISGWPLLGTLARKIGTVFVDRASSSSGAAALRDVGRLLKKGRRVTIFAEGTTFEGDEVHPFHPGAFLAAARANVPVLPVGIAYEPGSEAAFGNETFLDHLGRVASAPPSRVTIAIGDLMGPRRDSRAFAEETRRAVGDLIARARLADPSP